MSLFLTKFSKNNLFWDMTSLATNVLKQFTNKKLSIILFELELYVVLINSQKSFKTLKQAATLQLNSRTHFIRRKSANNLERIFIRKYRNSFKTLQLHLSKYLLIPLLFTCCVKEDISNLSYFDVVEGFLTLFSPIMEDE